MPLSYEDKQTYNDFLWFNNFESDKVSITDLQFSNIETKNNYALPRVKIKIENCVKDSEGNYELIINASLIGRNIIKLSGLNIENSDGVNIDVSMKINNSMISLNMEKDNSIIILTDVSFIGVPIKIVVQVRTSVFEPARVYASNNFTIEKLNDDTMTLNVVKERIDNYGN